MHINSLEAAFGRHPDLIPADKLDSILAALPDTSILRDEIFTSRDIKSGARDLGDALKLCGCPQPHGKLLKVVSNFFGFKTWNAARAVLESGDVSALPEAIPYRAGALGFCAPRALYEEFSELCLVALDAADKTPRTRRYFGDEPVPEHLCGGVAIIGSSPAPQNRIAWHLGAGRHYANMHDLAARMTVLAHDPDVVIFDRPDPLCERTMSQLINLHYEGHHVIIATNTPEAYAHIVQSVAETSRVWEAFIREQSGRSEEITPKRTARDFLDQLQAE